MINLPTKILLAIKPMRMQFKFTLRLICTLEYKYTPEYIYTRVFFAHANWTLDTFCASFQHGFHGSVDMGQSTPTTVSDYLTSQYRHIGHVHEEILFWSFVNLDTFCARFQHGFHGSVDMGQSTPITVSAGAI